MGRNFTKNMTIKLNSKQVKSAILVTPLNRYEFRLLSPLALGPFYMALFPSTDKGSWTWNIHCFSLQGCCLTCQVFPAFRVYVSECHHLQLFAFHVNKHQLWKSIFKSNFWANCIKPSAKQSFKVSLVKQEVRKALNKWWKVHYLDEDIYLVLTQRNSLHCKWMHWVPEKDQCYKLYPSCKISYSCCPSNNTNNAWQNFRLEGSRPHPQNHQAHQ